MADAPHDTPYPLPDSSPDPRNPHALGAAAVGISLSPAPRKA